MVPMGYTVVLYADDGLTGSHYTVSGKEDSQGRMVCQDLGGKFADSANSLTVMKNKTQYAQGRW